MNVAKLSISTRMGINNNFGFPKGENGTIGAFVKVSKNIDKELKDLGASIQGFMQGQPTGELFTIRFPINSLDKISEIDGLVYLDIGEKLTIDPPINKEYQDAKNQQNALNQQNNLTSKYVFNQDFEAQGTNLIPKDSKMVSLMLKYSFKKGDVFEGEKIPTNSGVETGSTPRYNVNITTPQGLKRDGTKFDGKSIFEVPNSVVTEQTLITDASGETFLKKHKNHLLILGALVLGYLAYKKFNK